MQLIPVTDSNTAAAFLQVAVQLYRNDPNWIRPLDKDINEVFDKNTNKAFRTGEAVRWILKDDNGRLIGRIAAFTKTKAMIYPLAASAFLNASTTNRRPTCFLKPPKPGCSKKACRLWMAPSILANGTGGGAC
jgi:hypothetical protein